MFEHKTFENLLKGALGKVPSNVDKREGTIIYDAIAPICAELTQAYICLDLALKEGFADTASREYLIKRAKERGLAPLGATYSIVLADIIGNVDLKYGARFNVLDLNFFYIGEMEGEYYKLQCETIGTVGNISNGELTSLDNISGFKSGKIVEILSSARDDEDTEVFRKRYFDSFTNLAFGGNKADYMEKLAELNEDIEIVQNGGIGGIKVYRTPKGGGTVGITITNNSYTVPTNRLVSLVQEKIDPLDETGEGVGIVPIGHSVTISPVKGVGVFIETTIVLKNGYVLDDILGYIENAIENYLHSLRESWGNGDIVVRIAQVESTILSVNGVIDISDTKINGTAQNLILDEFSTPIKEGLNVIT